MRRNDQVALRRFLRVVDDLKHCFHSFDAQFLCVLDDTAQRGLDKIDHVALTETNDVDILGDSQSKRLRCLNDTKCDGIGGGENELRKSTELVKLHHPAITVFLAKSAMNNPFRLRGQAVPAKCLLKSKLAVLSDVDLRIAAHHGNLAVSDGNRLFHSDEIGTNGIACAMCHPDASNTHPETYPKFQTQLKKVALLRDMVNWCIENPLEGKPLPADDPRMLAIEAYILAQRAGTPLAAGKH